MDSVITEVTRRNIFDGITVARIFWTGRLNDHDFLARLYNLNEMPSDDWRYKTAASDIRQHMVNNSDWEPDWVFSDRRFNLRWCPDEELLRFLAETLHPVVRADADEVSRLLEMYNRYLAADGWQLYPTTLISGRPTYAARRLLLGADHAVTAVRTAVEPLQAEYINQQITRMNEALQNDVELAIGTAKELVEGVCKAILVERVGSCDDGLDLPALVKAAMKQLKLTPDDVHASAKGAEAMRIMLNNLASIAGRLAELRNLYGTGHGKEPSARAPGGRHARLAVGAAATLATFLVETHHEDPEKHHE